MYTIFHKESGRIEKVVSCPEDCIALQYDAATRSHIEGNFSDGGFYVDVVDNQPVTFPLRPSEFHEFNWTSKEWVDPRTMEDLRTACRNRINVARLNANQSGFIHEGKLFATDPLSRSDIDGINGYVTLYGMLPTDWVGAWKAEDNTYLPIEDLDAWKAFYGSMVAAGNTNFAISEQLKLDLKNAITAEEVEAIVWPT